MNETNHIPVEPGGASSALENDREFKAHVYQQLVDLQPFLSPDSQVAVLVQQDRDEDETIDASELDDGFALTLVATLGDYRIESEGRDTDVYEAFGIAKRRMLQQLEELYSTAVDTTERDAQIQSVIDGSHHLH